MLILALRLLLALDDHQHEDAHRACEIAVYALVSPQVTDDETTTTIGEFVSEIACRGDGL